MLVVKDSTVFARSATCSSKDVVLVAMTTITLEFTFEEALWGSKPNPAYLAFFGMLRPIRFYKQSYEE
ncbi:Uncharacterized protein TCM_012814 [Theobroma cacao]|uniref:Uncharacterized protein n=1 Tax=Theobroma cacao TaxID=3641 RepID=A0A061G2S0_THECC|nr:Uncharacterized protein TCM_012814 [Theobroma cacao]